MGGQKWKYSSLDGVLVIVRLKFDFSIHFKLENLIFNQSLNFKKSIVWFCWKKLWLLSIYILFTHIQILLNKRISDTFPCINLQPFTKYLMFHSCKYVLNQRFFTLPSTIFHIIVIFIKQYELVYFYFQIFVMIFFTYHNCDDSKHLPQSRKV